MTEDRSRPDKPKAQKPDGDEDSFQDQRDPQSGPGGQPRHWQGKDTGEQGEWHEEPEFDRRAAGRGQQGGLAGEYGREHEQRRNEQTKVDADYDRDSDAGRGKESMRDEGGSTRGNPKEHTKSDGGEIDSQSDDAAAPDATKTGE